GGVDVDDAHGGGYALCLQLAAVGAVEIEDGVLGLVNRQIEAEEAGGGVGIDFGEGWPCAGVEALAGGGVGVPLVAIGDGDEVFAADGFGAIFQVEAGDVEGILPGDAGDDGQGYPADAAEGGRREPDLTRRNGEGAVLVGPYDEPADLDF